MMKFTHGGNIQEFCQAFKIRPRGIVDFSSNINPFAVEPRVKRAIRSCLNGIFRYPDPQNTKLKTALSRYLKVGGGSIAVGNGSADLIYRTVQALKPQAGIIVSPAFSEYEKALREAGIKVKFIRLKEINGFDFHTEEIVKQVEANDIVIISNPNNPTGKIFPRKKLLFLMRSLRRKNTWLLLDEAFIDMEWQESLCREAAEGKNLVVLRSMTKFYGLAGLRLGYAVGPPGLIKGILSRGQPWPVNIMAQTAAEALLKDTGLKERARGLLLKERAFLFERLSRIKALKPYPTGANFIMLKINSGPTANKLQRRLLERGLLIRDCGNFSGLGNKYIRVAVKKHKDNLKLLSSLKAVLKDNEE
ncbi:MAG: threonine-phosphate decarboxylase CobD [Candidatus Omnitrophota bacterium]